MASNETVTEQVKLARTWKEATVTYFMPCYALCTDNMRKTVEILSENREAVVSIWKCCTTNLTGQSVAGQRSSTSRQRYQREGKDTVQEPAKRQKHLERVKRGSG
jgi:hypothetical protein